MSATQAENSAPSAGPIRWWQWLLMYPTLIAALIGAGPQYLRWIEAGRLGIDPDTVSEAEQQEKLWTKNQDCFAKRPPNVLNAGQLRVEVLACPSGDVLVKTSWPKPTSPVEFILKSKWIAFETDPNQTGE